MELPSASHSQLSCSLAGKAYGGEAACRLLLKPHQRRSSLVLLRCPGFNKANANSVQGSPDTVLPLEAHVLPCRR